jgi:hypothetical protein
LHGAIHHVPLKVVYIGPAQKLQYKLQIILNFLALPKFLKFVKIKDQFCGVANVIDLVSGSKKPYSDIWKN